MMLTQISIAYKPEPDLTNEDHLPRHLDLRFPTSRTQDGTDAMHTDPDYSAAYVILKTDGGLEGHGFTFTIGRGNEVCAAAIEAFRHLVVGLTLDEITADFGGVLAAAGERLAAAVARAREGRHPPRAGGHRQRGVGSVRARPSGKPVWKLLADMTPRAARLVHRLPLHHRRAHAGRGDRDARAARADEGASAKRELLRTGYPAYTTSVGWMGYSDEKVRAACAARRIADGWTHFKVKVGADPADDARRVGLVREAIGPTRTLMIDANQRWDVGEAIARVQDARAVQPAGGSRSRRARTTCWGTRRSRGRSRPIGVATGEHCANRVHLQAAAPGAGDQLLPDRQLPPRRREREPRGDPDGREVRRAGLSARRRRRPLRARPAPVDVRLHRGHRRRWTTASPSSSTTCTSTSSTRWSIRRARYMAPQRPGYSSEIKPESRVQYRYPDGPVWTHVGSQAMMDRNRPSRAHEVPHV